MNEHKRVSSELRSECKFYTYIKIGTWSILFFCSLQSVKTVVLLKYNNSQWVQ